MAQRRSSLKKWLFGLLFVGFGSGTGIWGWINPELPVIGAALQKLRSAAPSADGSTPSPLLSILPHKDPFTTPGTFEVSIAKVTVDAAELRQGHHADLQIKVSKKLAGGQMLQVWDSRYAGERASMVGREPVTATWSDKPFQVTWQPGEDFVVEIWDRNALFDKSLFLLDTTSGDHEFPLRPDSTNFAHLANGRRTANPSANSLRIESKRIGDAK